MMGMKSEMKKALKAKGINSIELASGRRVKLQNAKTVDIFKAYSKIMSEK